MLECGGDSFLTYSIIANNWEYIVGRDLFDITSFASCNASKDGNNVIRIKAVGAASILVKGKESAILHRLNSLFSNKQFTKISIKHCITINEKTNAA
jgi:hypothetical protein